MPRAAKPSPAPPAEPRPGWVRKTLFQPRVLIALAIIGAALLLTPYVRQWLPVLEELPEYQFDTSRIQVSNPNRWVPRGFVQKLIDADRLPAHVSLLQPGLAERVSKALAGHPWVRNVRGVCVTRSGIAADLDYRLPVLMVETRSGMYPVDRDGALLPPSDFGISDLQRFPLLKSASMPPSGPAGETWEDPVVLGAARLAEVLAPGGDLSFCWEKYQLVAIEANPRTAATVKLEDLSFELVTRGRSRILWGHAPGADDLEPTVSQKLTRLADYFSKHDGFESDGRPNRIDIRLFKTIEVSAGDTGEPR
ncbi:MAG: hypothetical protein U0992_23615 [Planctomycetaceae bacterium]